MAGSKPARGGQFDRPRATRVRADASPSCDDALALVGSTAFAAACAHELFRAWDFDHEAECAIAGARQAEDIMARTPSLNPKPRRASRAQRVATFVAVLTGSILVFVIGLSLLVLATSG